VGDGRKPIAAPMPGMVAPGDRVDAKDLLLELS